MSFGFQFYYSSINSLIFAYKHYLSSYFNSTIVQLIETRKNTTDFTCKNFNSTIVQLIVESEVMER